MKSTKMDWINKKEDKGMKHWTLEGMWSFCVRHNYFNTGSNKAYTSLLNFVRNNKPTDRHIQTAAIFIIARTSEFEDILDGGTDAVDAITDTIISEIEDEVVVDIEEEEE